MTPSPRRMFTAASSTLAPSSRTVVCRVQPPSCARSVSDGGIQRYRAGRARAKGSWAVEETSHHLNAHVRVGKAPAEVRHVAVVGARRPDEIRTLAGPLPVPRAEHRRAKAIPPRQRVELVADAVHGAVVGVAVVGRVGRS